MPTTTRPHIDLYATADDALSALLVFRLVDEAAAPIDITGYAATFGAGTVRRVGDVTGASGVASFPIPGEILRKVRPSSRQRPATFPFEFLTGAPSVEPIRVEGEVSVARSEADAPEVGAVVAGPQIVEVVVVVTAGEVVTATVEQGVTEFRVREIVTGALGADVAQAVSDYLDANPVEPVVPDDSVTEAKLSPEARAKLNGAAPLASLTAHTARTDNPHGVTPAALGIEPGATADQTGAEIVALIDAEPNTNLLTDAERAALAGAVPSTRTVAGKPLSADVTLTAADVGARAAGDVPLAEVTGLPEALAAKVPLASGIVINHHGANAQAPRIPGATNFWHGSVEPENMAELDHYFPIPA